MSWALGLMSTQSLQGPLRACTFRRVGAAWHPMEQNEGLQGSHLPHAAPLMQPWVVCLPVTKEPLGPGASGVPPQKHPSETPLES